MKSFEFPLKYFRLLTIGLILLTVCSTLLAQDKKFELAEINFIGNEKLPDSDLLKAIVSRESPGWILQFLNSFSSFGSEPVYFDPITLKTDIENLRNFYQDNGFFETKISSDYEIDSLNSEAIVNFRIDEGDESFFSKIELNNLDDLPDVLKSEISSTFDIDTTERFSGALLLEKISFARTYLLDNGYMLASIGDPQVTIDTALNRVFVEVNFSLGNMYSISNVEVEKTGEGRKLVNDTLLKQIVNINPGDLYQNFALQRGQLRLYRTNLFNSALVSSVISDTLGNKVPIRISADVGLMNEFSPELILNDEDNSLNLGFGLAFIRKNFLGSARKLTISTSAAAQNLEDFLTKPLADTTTFGYTDARLILEQPFLFGSPINTSLQSYVTLQKRHKEFNATLWGVELNMDFELPPHTYLSALSLYLRWERAKFVYSDDYLFSSFKTALRRAYDITGHPLDSLTNAVVSGINKTIRSDNAVLGIQISANKTNDIIFPTNGYSVSFLVEDGNSLARLVSEAAGSNFSSPLFIKSVFTGSAFLPFGPEEKYAFGIRFRTGNIFTYKGDKAKLPLNQRFYAGGSNSVRGWRSRDLVPNEPNFDFETTNEDLSAVLVRGIVPGGFFLIEGNLEARLRFYEQFGMALFFDYGNTWNEPQSFQFKKLAAAAGFGFRYYSNFFPIRIDFGVRVYDPNDTRSLLKKVFWDTFTFHLGIGEAF